MLGGGHVLYRGEIRFIFGESVRFSEPFQRSPGAGVVFFLFQRRNTTAYRHILKYLILIMYE